jgi:hypothetical protein
MIEEPADAIGAAAANVDEAGPRHAAQQRAHLLDLAAAGDSARWDHTGTDATFRVHTEHARIAVGDQLRDGVDATVRADWHRGGRRGSSSSTPTATAGPRSACPCRSRGWRSISSS